MVSSVALIALATAFVATESAAFPQQGQQDFDRYIQSLEVGVCFRPGNDIATGFNASLPCARSPCPALNALANCGHIDRYGKQIIKVELGKVLKSVFSFDDDVSNTLLAPLPDTFSLDILALPITGLEHLASLVHSDRNFGNDPMDVNQTLLHDLLGRSLDGKTLGVIEIGQARRDRLAMCKATNPPCVLDERHTRIAYLEAAVVILAFGGNRNESVTVEAANSFLGEERIPSDYQKSATLIGLPLVGSVVAKLRAFA